MIKAVAALFFLGAKALETEADMDVMVIKNEELMEGVQIGGVANYLEKAEKADMNLFI